MLRSIEQASFSENDFHKWQQGSAVDPIGQQKSLLQQPLTEMVPGILSMNERIASINNKISAFEEHIRKVFTNQERLRNNIKSLEKVTGSELVKVLQQYFLTLIVNSVISVTSTLKKMT